MKYFNLGCSLICGFSSPHPHHCIKLPYLYSVHCLHDKHTPCITLLDLNCSSVRASVHPTSLPAPWNLLDDSAWWPQQAASTNIAVQRISPHQWSITFSFSSCSSHSWKPAGKSHFGGKWTILAQRHHPHLKRIHWGGWVSCPETGSSFCCTAGIEKCFKVCVLSGSSPKRRTFLWRFSWDNWLPVSMEGEPARKGFLASAHPCPAIPSSLCCCRSTKCWFVSGRQSLSPSGNLDPKAQQWTQSTHFSHSKSLSFFLP